MKNNKEKRKAVYAGSFDPITNGHIDIINRVAPLYDEVVVVVAQNENKATLFSLNERVQMTREAVSYIPHVNVVGQADGLTVAYAQSIGARVLIRGVRSFADWEYEKTVTDFNRSVYPDIETILILASNELSSVSSSSVKGVIGADKNWCSVAKTLVPPNVLVELERKSRLSEMALPCVENLLRKRWVKFWTRMGLREGRHDWFISEEFGKLFGMYTNEDRKYHTMKHIESCLDECESVREWIENRNSILLSVCGMLGEEVRIDYQSILINLSVIELALWFHDAGKTEEESVQIAREVVSKGYDTGVWFLDRIEKAILATKHDDLVYCQSQDASEEIFVLASGRLDPYRGVTEGSIVADIDLSILGKPPVVFDEYEKDVRKEYPQFSNEEFTIGRLKILQKFLERPYIYQTDFFRSKYETAARENLEQSVRRLKIGSSLCALSKTGHI